MEDGTKEFIYLFSTFLLTVILALKYFDQKKLHWLRDGRRLAAPQAEVAPLGYNNIHEIERCVRVGEGALIPSFLGVG